MTTIGSYLPSTSSIYSHTPRSVRRIISSFPGQSGSYNANLGIIWGTAGASAAVYLIWQYVDRDGSNFLGSASYWSGLDMLIDWIAGTDRPGGFRLSDGQNIVYNSGSVSQRWRQRVSKFVNENLLFHLGDAGARPWTMLTNVVSHRTMGHLLFNLSGLIEFGRCLSPSIRPSQLVNLMVCSAVAGNVTWAIHAGFRARREQRKAGTDKPSSNRYTALGLSSVVQGMGMAVTYLHPWATASPTGIIRLPLWLCTSAYILTDLWSVNDENSTVGHAAHLGGAAMGLVFASVLMQRPAIELIPGQAIKRSAYI